MFEPDSLTPSESSQHLSRKKKRNINYDVLKTLILSLIGTRPIEDSLDGLCHREEQWAFLRGTARQHRLEPLLHERARYDGDRLAIPQDVQAEWEEAFRASAMSGLAHRVTLIRLDAILSEFGIAYAALKGARLAWHAYSHPGLRPMRDLDVLVSPGRAMDAYDALVAKGFQTPSDSKLLVEFALRHHKHLPGLMDPQTGTSVEIHTRLFEDEGSTLNDSTAFDCEKLLENRVLLGLGNAQIAYLTCTETLIHLIIHSTHEHLFDNGPQVLNDLATLINSGEIDWSYFWTVAAEAGLVRSCQLLLALTEKYHAIPNIDFPESISGPVPSQILQDTELLMLQDFIRRGDLAVQRDLNKSRSSMRRANLWRRLTPARHVLAEFSGSRAGNPLAFIHYPLWFASKLARTIRGVVDPVQRAEVVRASRVEDWFKNA